MDYQRIYDEFIADRLVKYPFRGKVKGRELHHIVPKGAGFGGTNDERNLISLTSPDHLFAHMLLAKIHGGRMSSAFHLMLQNSRYQGRVSRVLYDKFAKEARKGVAAMNKGKPQHPNLAASLAAYNATRKLPKEEQERLKQARNAPRPHASTLPRTAAQLALLERGRRLPMTPARFAALEKGRHAPRTESQLAAISRTGKLPKSPTQLAALDKVRAKGVEAARIASIERKKQKINAIGQFDFFNPDFY